MNIIRYARAVAVALLLLGLGIPCQAAIKCWTDKNGDRACGDSVPPEYSQKSHQEISDQGLLLEEHDRAKTPEELEIEAKRQAAEEERQQREQEQARLDKILLDTFSSVDDIIAARDSKIGAIDSTISLAKRRNEKIQADLDARMEAAAEAERKGKKPGDELLQDIDSLKRQISNNEQFIQDRKDEKTTVMDAYNQDIERFKQLKAGPDELETSSAEPE